MNPFNPPMPSPPVNPHPDPISPYPEPYQSYNPYPDFWRGPLGYISCSAEPTKLKQEVKQMSLYNKHDPCDNFGLPRLNDNYGSLASKLNIHGMYGDRPREDYSIKLPELPKPILPSTGYEHAGNRDYNSGVGLRDKFVDGLGSMSMGQSVMQQLNPPIPPRGPSPYQY